MRPCDRIHRAHTGTPVVPASLRRAPCRLHQGGQADGLYRFFNGHTWNWPIRLGHHLFTDTLDEKQATEAWKAWLEKEAP